MISAERLRALPLVFWAYMLLAIITPASAQIPNELCLPLHGVLGGLVPIGGPEINALTVKVGRIVGSGPAKTLFVLPNCGDERPPSGCAGSQTLPIPTGFTVVILKSDKGYRCVSTADRTRHTEAIGGWVLERRVSVYPKWPNVPTRSWIGTWVMEDNNITITTAAGGFLRFVGNARYDARDGVKLGSFDDRLRPAGAIVDLSSADRSLGDGCSVSMGLMADMLAVFDQGGCDGINVSFTGFYIRQKHAK
jgi:hypothetical protein